MLGKQKACVLFLLLLQWGENKQRGRGVSGTCFFPGKLEMDLLSHSAFRVLLTAETSLHNEPRSRGTSLSVHSMQTEHAGLKQRKLQDFNSDIRAGLDSNFSPHLLIREASTACIWINLFAVGLHCR